MHSRTIIAALAALGLAATPALAQSSMPGMEMGGGAGVGHSLSMPSSVDLNSPMSQEASGTAWLPASSPMYGHMIMKPNGDMLMLHGAVTPRYGNVGSRRGDRRFDAPNWFMGMYSHPLGPKDQLGLRAMISLDPITEGGYGYPLLFQTGETWHNQPLHDRQHPHDLFSELSATYSRLIGGGNSVYLYLGYPGEPALGPPTFMHRLIAFDLPDAPIGHHWQDATHITFGVATAGINLGNTWKIESSVFTGREPNENRFNFDQPRFDSQSARLSYNPNANNAFQISYGFQKNPEGDGANVHRTTASWLYNRPLGPDSNVTTTLVWGQNNTTGEGKTNSFLEEADWQNGRDTVFTRLEQIQKSGHELVLPEELHGNKFSLGAYTLGYIRDLTHGRGIDTGIGAALTVNTKPSSLNPFYGPGTPVSFQVMLRLRPSREKMGMAGGPLASNSGATAPGGGAEAAPAGLAVHIAATMTPNTPLARRKNTLTLTITGADGKPLTGATIKADVAMTSMDMGTSHPVFRNLGNGRYQGDVTFSMPGPWRVTVSVTPHGGSAIMKPLDYRVGC